MDFTLLYSFSPCHAPCALDAACNLASFLFPSAHVLFPFCAHFYRGFLQQILIDKERFALVESAARQSLWNFYYIVFHFLHGAVNSWNQQRDKKTKRVASICKADSSHTRRIRNVLWHLPKSWTFRACPNVVTARCAPNCVATNITQRVELPEKFIMRNSLARCKAHIYTFANKSNRLSRLYNRLCSTRLATSYRSPGIAYSQL